MLVGERMNSPVITVSADMPINEAMSLMKSKRIRRAPVIADGKLVGIVSVKDLLNASPSPATTLSIWEMSSLLSKVTIQDVMSTPVLTVTEDTPIEEAARIMADNKVGGLPVLRVDQVVGIITETDLFKLFLELMGARESGVRVTVLLTEKPGELARLTRMITELGGNFIALGQMIGHNPANRMLTFKVSGLSEDQVRQGITPIVERVMDIRTV